MRELRLWPDISIVEPKLFTRVLDYGDSLRIERVAFWESRPDEEAHHRRGFLAMMRDQWGCDQIQRAGSREWCVLPAQGDATARDELETIDAWNHLPQLPRATTGGAVNFQIDGRTLVVQRADDRGYIEFTAKERELAADSLVARLFAFAESR